VIALGIEGTAHTLGVGVVDQDGRVLSNLIDMHRPPAGGIHPREAANHHAEVAPGLIHAALEKAGVRPSELDLVSFSQGPGLGPCLRTAATAARALALKFELPLVGVNHCVAHIEIGRAVCGCEDPVMLYASGGNTQVVSYLEGRYRVFGETLDIGVGNMLDKFGLSVGMSFPCGPEIERRASGGERLLELPYSVKGMDVAFSGMITAAQRLLEKGAKMEDLCFSIQETAFAMLIEVAERAMAHLEKQELLLAGGVACNRRLQEMAEIMTRERGARSFAPPRELCIDNGAMIAWTGLLMFRAGNRTPLEKSAVDQRQRTDQVEVTWR